MKKVHEKKEIITVATLKRVDNLLNALEHIQTANVHDKEINTTILSSGLANYKDNPTWDECKKLRKYCEKVEGFLYRVIKKYDKH